MLINILILFFGFLVGFFLCAILSMSMLNRLEDKKFVLEVTRNKVNKAIKSLKRYQRRNVKADRITRVVKLLESTKEDIENENSKDKR